MARAIPAVVSVQSSVPFQRSRNEDAARVFHIRIIAQAAVLRGESGQQGQKNRFFF